MRWTRRERWGFAAVLAMATVVRVLAARASFTVPYVTNYLVVGARRATGTLHGERLLDWSPFYAGVATALEALGLPSRPALAALQVLAGVALVAVCYLLARRAAGPAAGLGAGVCCALCRSLVVVGAAPVPDLWLVVFLLAGGLVAGFDASWSAPTGGLLFGLAALVRPTALVGPVLAVSLRRWRTAAVQLAIAVLAVLAGLWAWLSTGGVRPPDWPALMSPGAMLFLGNGAGSTGVGSADPPSVQEVAARWDDGVPDVQHAGYRIVARAIAGSCLAPPGAEGYWRALAVRYVQRHPERALTRLWRSVVGLLQEPGWWDLPGAVELEERLRWLAPVSLTLLLPLAALALLLAPKQIDRGALPAIAVGALTAILFLAATRYRVPLDGGLTVLAGIGVAALLGARVSAGRARLVVAAIVALALAVLTRLPLAGGSAAHAGWEAYADERLRAGVELWRRGGSPGAFLPLVADALVRDPTLRPQVPAALLDEPLRRTVAATATAALQEREVDARIGGLAALVLLADECPASVRAASEAWTGLDGEQRGRRALLLARCDLMSGDAAGAQRRLAAVRVLPLDGEALRAASLVQAGLPPARAMSSFSHEHDPLSELLAASSALRSARQPRLAEQVERVFDQRLRAGIACTPTSR